MKLIAIAFLTLHLLWIIAVIFGAAFTRGRPVWSGLHIVSLIWGIIVELGPLPCPLTLAEQHFEARAGMHAYQGSFLLHYLDKIIYPNLPWWVVGTGYASSISESISGGFARCKEPVGRRARTSEDVFTEPILGRFRLRMESTRLVD